MLRDPLRRFPTQLRLWTAALLCLVVMGKVWSYTYAYGSPGITIPGYCADGFCTPDIGGVGMYSSPGSTTLVNQSPIAAPLAVSIALLVFTATRPRTPRTRRAARAATLLMAAAAVLAAAGSFTDVWLPLLAALAIVTPLVWNRPRRRVRAALHSPRRDGTGP